MTAQILMFRLMEEFPNRIRQVRKARGLSQEALGERVGCSMMHISGMERGTREVTVSWLQKIAAALDVPTGDLLTDEDNPYRPQTDDEASYFSRYRQARRDDRKRLERISEATIDYRGEGETERDVA